MCDCINKMDGLLAEKNIRIARGFQIIGKKLELSPPFVATEKLNPKIRKSPPTVIANYCPFCGEKFGSDAPTATDDHAAAEADAIERRADRFAREV